MEMTEEELKAKIEEEVKKAKAEQEAELKKQHDSEMAQARIKAKQDLDKAVEKAKTEASLSAEEKAKKEAEEKAQQEHDELVALREKVKVSERQDKLAKAGLPDFFKNDKRLLEAEDGDVDNIVETIKKEYEAVLPKGAKISTNIKGGSDKTTEQEELERVRKLGLSGK